MRPAQEKQTQANVFKRNDIKEMLMEFAVFNKKSKNMEISLASWVNFTYGFKGDFDVVDPRSGKVVQSFGDSSDTPAISNKNTAPQLPAINEKM